jgi:hypothetical protein
MQQNPMTVITAIKPESLTALTNYLQPIGTNIKNNSVIRFFDYQQLHYCSFFIIPSNHPAPAQSATPDLLVFEANIDGEVSTFISDLIAKNKVFMDFVYGCCEGYPISTSEQAAYLLNHDYGANAFFVAHPGQNRNTIYQQQQLRERIEQYVNANRPALVEKPDDIRATIFKHLESTEPKLTPPEPQPFLNRMGATLFNAILVVLVVALLAGLFGFLGSIGQIATIGVLAGFAVYLLVLRWHESRDQQLENIPWNADNVIDIQAVEDRQLQNHLTSVIEIKSGFFRLTTLRIVLFGINLVAKLVATKGNLSGIVTIHFARWVILPDKKRLLFMSNYDGSWENYLGEFIDHASEGLTAVWSNTQLDKNRGFPDTQWLFLKGGSRDEQRFKTFARNSQLAELIWYSAYTDLSVKNIANNRSIHEGLFSAANLATWLKCL